MWERGDRQGEEEWGPQVLLGQAPLEQHQVCYHTCLASSDFKVCDPSTHRFSTSLITISGACSISRQWVIHTLSKAFWKSIHETDRLLLDICTSLARDQSITRASRQPLLPTTLARCSSGRTNLTTLGAPVISLYELLRQVIFLKSAGSEAPLLFLENDSHAPYKPMWEAVPFLDYGLNLLHHALNSATKPLSQYAATLSGQVLSMGTAFLQPVT